MTIVVSDDSTREEVAEALTHLARKASRVPAHWTDRKAAIHAAMNDLLDQYEAMPATSAGAGNRAGV